MAKVKLPLYVFRVLYVESNGEEKSKHVLARTGTEAWDKLYGEESVNKDTEMLEVIRITLVEVR